MGLFDGAIGQALKKKAFAQLVGYMQENKVKHIVLTINEKTGELDTTNLTEQNVIVSSEWCKSAMRDTFIMNVIRRQIEDPKKDFFTPEEKETIKNCIERIP
jgi:hypothetical protein